MPVTFNDLEGLDDDENFDDVDLFQNVGPYGDEEEEGDGNENAPRHQTASHARTAAALLAMGSQNNRGVASMGGGDAGTVPPGGDNLIFFDAQQR